MIRTLVEIVSFSKFEFFEKDRKYHFRSFADKSRDLREKYVDMMLSDNPHKDYSLSEQVKAGYLIKEDGVEFKIKPAQTKGGCQYFRVEEDIVIRKKILSEPMNIRLRNGKYVDNRNYHFDFKRVKFTYESPRKHSNHSRPLFYAKITDICNSNQKLNSSIEGALVHSGWMRGPSNRPGKHLHWVIGPPSMQKKEFLPGVIEDYKNDVSRHEEANLLRYFKSKPNEEVPCFYIEENDKIKSFGHTGLFRLSYDYNLNNFLPKEMQEFTDIDITEALFGNETSFAGRVFFEDAVLCGNKEDALMDEGIPHILSKSKPTTFQHYLIREHSVKGVIS